MNCPVCSHPESAVVRTKPSEARTKRRRECARCHHRFTTYESKEDAVEELQKLRSVLVPVVELAK